MLLASSKFIKCSKIKGWTNCIVYEWCKSTSG